MSIEPGVVLVLLILGGSTLYGLGYATAVMRRANTDYKKTKTSLPGMRKDFWSAWWQVIKVGFWVSLAGLILVAWTVHDIRDTDTGPEPHPSTPVRST